jgi:hypothetical protein
MGPIITFSEVSFTAFNEQSAILQRTGTADTALILWHGVKTSERKIT